MIYEGKDIVDRFTTKIDGEVFSVTLFHNGVMHIMSMWDYSYSFKIYGDTKDIEVLLRLLRGGYRKGDR